MTDLKEKSIFINIAIGILYALLGVLIVLYPEISATLLFRILGVFILIHGVIKFISYFIRSPYGLLHRFDLVLGIFFITTGTFFIVFPQESVSGLAFIVGVLILISGLVSLQTACDGFRFGLKYWYIAFLSALITGAFALLLMFIPFKSVSWITVLIGIALILSGIEKTVIAIITLINKKNGKGPNDPTEVDFTDV